MATFDRNNPIGQISKESASTDNFSVGDAVTLIEDSKVIEGEVIGTTDALITVVYISPSGEYKINKFPPEEITKKGEISDLPVEEPEIDENIQKIKNQHIQGIKNTLITLLEYKPAENSNDEIHAQILQQKQEIIKNIQKIVTIENINIDIKNIQNINELSDEDIETLSQNLDFMNELIFLSVIDYSIVSSSQKPETMHIKEIQQRLTHFDTQAKALRDKKIQQKKEEIKNKRTEEENEIITIITHALNSTK